MEPSDRCRKEASYTDLRLTIGRRPFANYASVVPSVATSSRPRGGRGPPFASPRSASPPWGLCLAPHRSCFFFPPGRGGTEQYSLASLQVLAVLSEGSAPQAELWLPCLCYLRRPEALRKPKEFLSAGTCLKAKHVPELARACALAEGSLPPFPLFSRGRMPPPPPHQVLLRGLFPPPPSLSKGRGGGGGRERHRSTPPAVGREENFVLTSL